MASIQWSGISVMGPGAVQSYPRVTPLMNRKWTENFPKVWSSEEVLCELSGFYFIWLYMNYYHRWWEPRPQPTGGWGFHFNCGRSTPIILRDSAWWSSQSWVCCCFSVSYPRHGFEFCCFRFWRPNKRAILIAPKNGHFVATFFWVTRSKQHSRPRVQCYRVVRFGVLWFSDPHPPEHRLPLRTGPFRGSTGQDGSVVWRCLWKITVHSYHFPLPFSGRVKDDLPNAVVRELWVSCKVVPWTFCDIFWRNLVFYHLSSVNSLMLWYDDLAAKSSKLKNRGMIHFWWWRSQWETTRCSHISRRQVAATSITHSGVDEVPRWSMSTWTTRVLWKESDI